MWAPSQDTAAAPSSSFRSLAGHNAEGGREKTPAADSQGPGTDGTPARGSHCHSQEPPSPSQGQGEARARALSQVRPRRQKPAGQVQGRARGIALSKPSAEASPQTKSRAAPASSALSGPSPKASSQTRSRAAPASSALSGPSAKASPQTRSRAAPASRLAAVGQVQHQPAAQPEAVACALKNAAAERQSSQGAGRAAAPGSVALSSPVQQEAGEDFDVDIDLDPEAPGDPLLVPGGGCEASLPASALAAFARAAGLSSLSGPISAHGSANTPAKTLLPSGGKGDAMSSEDDAEHAEMTPGGARASCMRVTVADGSQ